MWRLHTCIMDMASLHKDTHTQILKLHTCWVGHLADVQHLAVKSCNLKSFWIFLVRLDPVYACAQTVTNWY